MANDKTTRTWILDTAGIITDRPVLITKAIIYPAQAAGITAVFRSWEPSSTPELAKLDVSCTVTGTNQIASTGNFPTASVDPGDVLVITRSKESGNNLGAYLIATNADNNTVTLDAANALTNEVKIYDFNVFTPVTQFTLLAPGTEVQAFEMDFSSPVGFGRVFPNLAMDDLTASCVVHLLIG